MKAFFLGVFLTLVAISFTAAFFIAGGHFYPGADAPVTSFEKALAKTALRAAIGRHEAEIGKPPVVDEKVIDAGMKVYQNQCMGCHGSPGQSSNDFAAALFPPAPQLIFHELHMPDTRCFFMTKHGVRWTGMPAWAKMLSDDDIWRVCSFLKNLEHLPPAVDKDWKSGGDK